MVSVVILRVMRHHFFWAMRFAAGRLGCLFLFVGLCQIRGADPVVATRGLGWTTRPLPPLTTGKTGFTLLAPSSSGIQFTNRLQGDLALTNAVAHNGSGVALGDVDGDGWVDVYLCALQGPNRLFRNLGGWRFQSMELGAAACAEQLSTGAVLVDVDGDGDLDLLVNGIAAGTRLFLNDGRAHWTEVRDGALSRTSTPMSMALADMDGDGDLDLFCATYTDAMYLADPTTRLVLGNQGGRQVVTHVNGQPATDPPWNNRFQVLPNGQVQEFAEADLLYRNEGDGRFTAIQSTPGTFTDERGQPMALPRELGLGAVFRDLNHDGLPDLFVCNDNGQPDRLWINQGKGKFRLKTSAMRHGSHSSMGLDVADVNRDGWDDLLVVDMLAASPANRLQHPGKSDWEPGVQEVSNAKPLFGRNSLYLGRPDGTFVETALMAGVAATDWSWCPVFVDVDLDGYEDLLITTGFEQNVLDADSMDQIRRRKWTPEQMKRYRQIHPRWDTETASFRNRGDGTFESMAAAWGLTQRGVANGMALADLDNDGDLDGVMNCLNAPATVWRNDTVSPRILVRLKGMAPNTRGIGARLKLEGGAVVQSQVIDAGGRYLSGDDAVRVFAASKVAGGEHQLTVHWPNGQSSMISNVAPNVLLEVDQAAASGSPGGVLHAPVAANATHFKNVSKLLSYVHAESGFDDWGLQPLLPYRLSRSGPFLAWHDLNADGWEDLIVTAARGGRIGIFFNQEGNQFQKMESPDPSRADHSGIAVWWNGRGDSGLVLSESAYELPTGSASRLLLFLSTAFQPLSLGTTNVGPVSVGDLDRDGDLDVFVAGRPNSGKFPEPGRSTLWRNDQGTLRLDGGWTESIRSAGLVRSSTIADLDGDGVMDLAVATDWGPVRVYRNVQGHLEDMTKVWRFAESSGRWSGIAAGDVDGDGRLDLVVGNEGRNSVYELRSPGPMRLYFGDWNGLGSVQLVEARKAGTHWMPWRDRNWLARGFPGIEQRFATHGAFSQATIADLLGATVSNADWLEVTTLESSVFLNRGSHFERRSLPPEAQWSPVASVHISDLDGDGLEDIFLSQNHFGSASGLTRDDAGRGLWLRGRGDGAFQAVDASESGIVIEGEQRGAAVADFNRDGRVDIAVGQNGGETMLYLNERAKPGLRVLVRGTPANPAGVGAILRLNYGGSPSGPVRAIQVGSGWGSCDGTTPVLGMRRLPESLWIRWPGGAVQVIPIPNGAREIEARQGK